MFRATEKICFVGAAKLNFATTGADGLGDSRRMHVGLALGKSTRRPSVWTNLKAALGVILWCEKGQNITNWHAENRFSVPVRCAVNVVVAVYCLGTMRIAQQTDP